MFTLATPQKVCHLGDFRIGGQPGENPPLLIASMFHNGDRILESRKERKFNKAKALDYIKRQEELSAQTGIPALVAMVATTADEMKTYVDFFASVSDMPFGIDMWVEKARLESAKYVAQAGLAHRLLYNSITPWDKDIPAQAAALKEMGIKHVVVQAFDEQDQQPSGRLTSCRKMLQSIGENTFESILIDTSVMNLPATAISCMANKLIKEEFGWPSGVASSNGTYMWKEAREMFGSDGFTGLNAAGQAISAMFWSDLIFYGPIVSAPKIFPAVLSAALMLATFVYTETGKLPENKQHPLYKFFDSFAEKLVTTAS